MTHKFKREFGQNFLKHDRFAKRLVDALELEANETVVEIGPGEGRVTNLLLQQGMNVVAIEVDYSLLPNLIKRFGDKSNFEIIHEDVMSVEVETELSKLASENTFSKDAYKITGSLPYNISKQIIRKFLTAHIRPQKAAFIVQEEVAKDYVAQAPKATFLSNWVRLFAEVKKLESIPASQFKPQPKVNGGILVITPYAEAAKDLELKEEILRIAFSNPRKTLWNNLKSSRRWDTQVLTEVWQTLGLKEKQRPAELELSMWEQVFIGLSK